MNKNEALGVLSLVRSAFPAQFRGMSREDAGAMADLWSEMFPESEDVVRAAVKAYIASDSTGFAPSIGKVREIMYQLILAPRESELEMWGRVLKAVRNGIYGAEKEWELLPREAQLAVGDPQQIRAWAKSDEKQVSTVAQAAFLRSYRNVLEKKRERALCSGVDMVEIAGASAAIATSSGAAPHLPLEGKACGGRDPASAGRR